MSNTTQRTFSSAVELSLGMVSLHVDLAPMRRPNLDRDGELKFACPNPVHRTPEPVQGFFRCRDGHEHRERELGRMRVVDDETTIAVNDDEATAVRCGPLDKKGMTLSVHPAAEVEAATIADATAYRCRLPKGASKNQVELYGVLLALVADRTKAYVGTLRVRDSRSVYRLTAHRGQLSLVSLVMPQDLAATDTIDVPKVDAAKVKIAKELADAMLEPFDPTLHYHDVGAAMAELIAGKVKNPSGPVAEPAVAPAEVDWAEMLRASKKVVAARKAPAKRARKTPARKAS
jgi:non-homologous end joining protein Ku